jgi:hypothetical protein
VITLLQFSINIASITLHPDEKYLLAIAAYHKGIFRKGILRAKISRESSLARCPHIVQATQYFGAFLDVIRAIQYHIIASVRSITNQHHFSLLASQNKARLRTNSPPIM